MTAFNANYDYAKSHEFNMVAYVSEFITKFEPIATLSPYYQLMSNWRRILLDAHAYDAKLFELYLDEPYKYRDDNRRLATNEFIPLVNSHTIKHNARLVDLNQQDVVVSGVNISTEQARQVYQDIIDGTADMNKYGVIVRVPALQVQSHTPFDEFVRRELPEILSTIYVTIGVKG